MYEAVKLSYMRNAQLCIRTNMTPKADTTLLLIQRRRLIQLLELDSSERLVVHLVQDAPDHVLIGDPVHMAL